MSAIISAEDLNDFINPGVACIKPIELPKESSNPYEVTTEEKIAAAAPTLLSLTDCLACSGCVTSAEAMLVSLQSHDEVLNALDKNPSLSIDGNGDYGKDGTVFVASVSPQARASLASVFGVTEEAVGNMVSHLLSGPDGLAKGGAHGSSFSWIVDTNALREITLVAAAEEVSELLQDSSRQCSGDGTLLTDKPKGPILTSACPGWICYVEKTLPYVLPHLSRLKSPQALAGTLLKSVLYKTRNIHPSRVWHVAIMPCFDKKLEASRSELTSELWLKDGSEPVRDVDCAITARELLSLAAARGIDFGSLPKTPLPQDSRRPFPDSALETFLFPSNHQAHPAKMNAEAVGTSGGYLWHTLRRLQTQHPGSQISVTRGRNSDVVEFALHAGNDSSAAPIVKLARYYGFRNIQNLVRRLRPKRTNKLTFASDRSGSRRPNGARASADGVDYAYVEVMACPGGCTNGGGQIRVEDVNQMLNEEERAGKGTVTDLPKKEWLQAVDDKYWGSSDDESSIQSTESDMSDSGSGNGSAPDIESNLVAVDQQDVVDGISRSRILAVVSHWSNLVGVENQELLCTSYRKVESDVGKKKGSDVDRIAALAVSIGGGW